MLWALSSSPASQSWQPCNMRATGRAPHLALRAEPLPVRHAVPLGALQLAQLGWELQPEAHQGAWLSTPAQGQPACKATPLACRPNRTTALGEERSSMRRHLRCFTCMLLPCMVRHSPLASLLGPAELPTRRWTFDYAAKAHLAMCSSKVDLNQSSSSSGSFSG